MKARKIPLELNRDAWNHHNMNYYDLFNEYKKVTKLIDEVILDDTDSNVEVKKARGRFDDLSERLKSIESAINNLSRRTNDVEGLYTFSNGGARVVKSDKPDSELVPYIVDESLKGDLSEEAINILYERLTANHIYGLYDGLVEDDPEQRHKHFWGELDDGSPLYYYHFRPEMSLDIPENGNTGEPRFDVYNRLLASKPIVFITSGVHGNEKTNIWAMYLTIKDILEGKTELDRYIKRNYDIVILPACNPYGLLNNDRNNENNVNINRNFSYKWEGDKSSDKGSAPFSEISSRFIRDIRDKYVEDTNFRQGMLFIDSHDFNWTNYSNDRVLWSGANNRDLRRTLINIGGVVKERLIDMFPDLVTSSRQKFINYGATGVGYGATINAWNWNDGIKGYSLECVNDLRMLGVEQKYSIEGAKIGYEVVRNFVIQSTIEQSGVKPPSTIVGFNNALSNNSDSFMKTLQMIPSGRTFITGVYSNNNFSKYMPLDPKGETYRGVFTATKSDASKTSSGFMEFTTTNYKYVRRFYASFNGNEISEWYEVGRGVVHTEVGSVGLNNNPKIMEVYDAMGEKQIGEFYVAPSSTNFYLDLPSLVSGRYGNLRIVKNTDLTGHVEFTDYGNFDEDIKARYIASVGIGKLGGWYKIGLEKVK